MTFNPPSKHLTTSALVSCLLALFLASCGKSPEQPEAKPAQQVAPAAPVAEPAAPAEPQESAPQTPPVSFDYEGEELEVGGLFEYETKTVNVKMKNESGQDLVINSISPTCNCTSVVTFHTAETLPAGATLDIAFNVIAHKIPIGEFHRNVLVDLEGFEAIKIFYHGEVYAAAIIRPTSEINLGLLTSSTQPWERELEIAGAVNLPEELVFPEHINHKYFNLDISRYEKNNYTLKLTPRAPLPYGRKFKEKVKITPARPLGIKPLELTILAHVGEKVTFTPQDLNFKPLLLQKQGSLTAGAAFGLVPGYKYEPPEEAYKSRKEQLRAIRTQQPSSTITLEEVMTNIDWNVLMEQLEFEVPEHVTVEKIRHSGGIELKVTVTPQAFALSKNLKIVPHCGDDKFRPINLTSYENPPRRNQPIKSLQLPKGFIPPPAAN
jgi:hypothetical protein